MTNREKAICEVYTGICFCAGEKREHVYKYASELLGRPVFTHEFNTLAAELKARATEDFIAICQDRYQEPKQDQKVDRGCETCKHARLYGYEYPCCNCDDCDKWEAAP